MNQISGKNVSQMMLLITLLSALFCGICFLDARKVKATDITIYTEDADLSYELENIVLENDILTVKGWVVQIGQEIQTFDIATALYRPEDNTLYELPTQYEQRSDITERFNDGTSYDNSGFLTKALINQFNMSEYQYELCIVFKSNDCKYLLHTGQYIGGNWDTINITQIDATDCKRSNDLQCGLEAVECINDILTVNGWIVYTGRDSVDSNISVVLYDSTHRSFFALPTECIKRTDVTEFINDETNYDDSGFQSSISIQQLTPAQICYEVCIMYKSQGTSYLLHTGQYVGGTGDVQ